MALSCYCGKSSSGVNTNYPVSVNASASVNNSYSNTQAQITITVSAKFTINTWTQSSGLMCQVSCNGITKPTSTTYSGLIGNGHGTIKYSYPNEYTIAHTFTIDKISSTQSIGWSVNVHASYDMADRGAQGTISDNATIAALPIYTVTYNANGGAGSMDNSTVTYNQPFTTPQNAFTKEGYIFTGWNESADGTGTDWTDWIGKPWTWTYTKNITLYAQWTKSNFDITFHGNGGFVKSIEDSDFQNFIVSNKGNGVDFSLSNIVAEKYGYAFKYWLAKQADTSLSLKNGHFYEYDDAYIKKAWLNRLGNQSWEVLVYAVNCSKIQFPTWTAYKGQDDLASPWIELESGNWTENGHTFNFGGQIHTSEHNNELLDYYTHLYALDSNGNHLSSRSLAEGYHVEFYSDESYAYDQDVTLYAQWEAKSYNISIDFNGGKYTNNQTQITFDKALSFGGSFPLHHFPADTPARDFYKFEGLFDADGVKVYDKDRNALPCKYFDTTSNTYIYDGDLILYAHWKPLNCAYIKNNDHSYKTAYTYCKTEENEWRPAIAYVKTEQGWKQSIVGKETI